jgi:hypothetical protein
MRKQIIDLQSEGYLWWCLHCRHQTVMVKYMALDAACTHGLCNVIFLSCLASAHRQIGRPRLSPTPRFNVAVVITRAVRRHCIEVV